MKSLQCHTYGTPDDLIFIKTERQQPQSNEVSIRICAVGLNYPDTLTIQGKDQYGLSLPFVPGREFSGIIEEIGSEVRGFQKGDRVMARVMEGALQEFCCVPVKNIYALPDDMTFTQASIFLMAYGTAYHALVDRAQIRKNETVVILGASGGVGSALIELSKNFGAKVIAVTSSNEKAAYCKSLGADSTLVYNTSIDIKNELKQLTDGKGADVICDMLGGHFSEQAFRAIGYNGRHLIIGFTSENIPKIPMNLPLLKTASIVGVFWSTFSRLFPEKNDSNVNELIKLFSENRITPRVHKIYDFSEAKLALNELSTKQVKGKISILFN